MYHQYLFLGGVAFLSLGTRVHVLSELQALARRRILRLAAIANYTRGAYLRNESIATLGIV